jgi:hypothetical protein
MKKLSIFTILTLGSISLSTSLVLAATNDNPIIKQLNIKNSISQAEASKKIPDGNYDITLWMGDTSTLIVKGNRFRFYGYGDKYTPWESITKLKLIGTGIIFYKTVNTSPISNYWCSNKAQGYQPSEKLVCKEKGWSERPN